MRILYLHQYFNTPSMSGGTRSYEMARRLVAAGHEVHVITTDRAAEDGVGEWRSTEESGIRVHWLPVPYSNRMSFRRRLRAFFGFAMAAGRKARTLGGDVVFATSTPLTIALPAIGASRALRVPMVFEVRDLWPELPVAVGALRNPAAIAAARWLERRAYRNAVHVVTLSPEMKEGVLRTGVPPQRVSVIPNGCDLDMFRVGPAAGRDLRGRYAWLGDRPLVVYIGTLGLINGVDYLARLAGAAHALDPEVRFVVIGSGMEVESVRSAAEEEGVLGESFFMFERIPKRDVPAWLSAADVATSLFIDLEEMWANSANKFFDALAAGRPIMINHGGWQADLLQKTGAGIVVPPNDAERAAGDLLGLLGQPDRLRRAGQAAAALAEERFDRDELAHSLRKVLEGATTIDSSPCSGSPGSGAAVIGRTIRNVQAGDRPE